MPAARLPVLVAPDSFKGSFAAEEVAAAIVRGLDSAGIATRAMPIADGGEGTGEALRRALGGELRSALVHDPLGRMRRASFVLLADGRAVVEVAQASGLATIAARERDAEAASSAGTGELIVAAIESGAGAVLVAAGGSATTDGGTGAIDALASGGGLRGRKLAVLCDVRTPFDRAAALFAPQKGADAATVVRLEQRLARVAAKLPRDPRGIPLSGAAGGLAGGLWAAFEARLEQGASFVLDAIGFDRTLRASHAVILGEGRLDRTTLEGKALAEAATRARQLGVPAHAIVGQSALDAFDARILDLQTISAAGALDKIESAARGLAAII
jgi:glycerate kinase